MSKITLLLNVYNEADMLPYLDVVLKYVDEAIITEGSAIGLSIDNTAEIIKGYQKKYPIKFFQGTFIRDDGGYAEADAKNQMLEAVSPDSTFIMLHHADLIYDVKDMVMFREAVDKFPSKAIFYTAMREFLYDMEHIRLYSFPPEDMLHRPLVGDVPAIATRLDLYYLHSPGIALQAKKSWQPNESLFMPDVVRYHLGFVRAFPYQVEKRLNHITQRDWGERGEELISQGFNAIFNAALEHVETFATDPSIRDYFGNYPRIFNGRKFSVLDGRGEFYDNIEKYKERLYGYYQAIEARV